jgi:hypothetical protein
MRDDVGAFDRSPNTRLIADIGFDEFTVVKPIFGTVAGQADDLVALGPQAGRDSATEYATGAGDCDFHG